MLNNTNESARLSNFLLPKHPLRFVLGLVIIAIIALLAFGFSTPSYCQSDEQQEEDCDNYDQKEYNDRINCKAKKLNEKMGDVVNMIADIPEDDLSETTKQHINNSQRRMERTRERTHEAKGFSKVAKKQKASQGCYIKEIEGDGIGNDNGICGDDKHELQRGCVEETGDGDGICEKGGQVKETCVEVCDQENMYDEDDEDIYDPEAAADMEEALEDNTEALGLLEDALEERIAVLNSMRSEINSMAANGEEDACQDLQASGGISLAALIPVASAKALIEGAHEVCDDVAGTNVVGNNWLFACAVFAAAASVADLALNILELIDDNILSNQINSYAECLKLTSAQLEQALEDLNAIGGEDGQLQTILDDIEAHNQTVLTKLEEIQTKILLLSAQVDDGFTEVETLLNTPQGQRPDFPSKDK